MAAEGPLYDSQGTIWLHWVWNGSSGKESREIGIVAVSRLPIPPEYIVADTNNPNWTVKVGDEEEGKTTPEGEPKAPATTIWFVAKPDQAIKPQT